MMRKTKLDKVVVERDNEEFTVGAEDIEWLVEEDGEFYEVDEPIGSGIEGPEDLAVEQLRLEDPPEALDLAVRPGRVDLRPEMTDAQLVEGIRQARQAGLGLPSGLEQWSMLLAKK